MTKPDLSAVPRPRVEELCRQYRSALLDDVIPWWLKHSLDLEHGGYYSLLERDGRPWGTDKYMWMNGREVWMFSHLFNTLEARPEWLDAARLGADFVLRHAFKDDGKMHFRLTRDGRSVSEVLSVYTEVFGAIAMAEYSKAANDERIWQRAMRMYDFLMARLGQPSDTPLLGYPTQAQFHLHAHDMCRITVAWVYDAIRPQQRFTDDLNLSAESIVGRHWKPEMRALLENVAMDGTAMLDMPEGRMFHPGHAIESAWMLLEIARRNGDEALVKTGVDIILASLEHGWDQEYGGLRYITNVDWTPTHELGANLKLWWPHNETLYALLLAWSLTGREDLWQWYQRVHDYSFSRFPDPEYGEWYGYLDRDGRPVWTAKANGWKGCFHLPRALYRCWQLLESTLASI
ncbi:MAG TPA: AGE family epimerase/isomerase [Phycisphaerae bacterium]|nr:AGE family epimerase/isomerase [Phycisphaerae bacterium]